jgi:hypothetical protein
MAFRSDDQDYRWPHPGHGRRDQQGQADRDQEASHGSLSLSDTLRELAVTILGFVGVIVLIIAAVSYFRG